MSDKITLRRGTRSWVAIYHGPDGRALQGLAGNSEVPTGIPLATPPDEVLHKIRIMHPDHVVTIESE